MLLRTLSAVIVTGLVLLAPSVTTAQIGQARLMGVVTDGSGGALPGVTVTISAGAMRPQSYVTDTSGQYLTAWLSPDAYTVTFILSGFETRVVNSVQIAAGQTVVLDQQLSLAPLSETVEVTAPAPPPPPPPPPVRFAPPPPEIKPVEKDVLASVCGPRQRAAFSRAVGKVVAHRDSDRQLLGPGDMLRIDAGEQDGLVKHQNLVVRSRFATGVGDSFAFKEQPGAFGDQVSALVQIVETAPKAAVAVIVYACSEVMAGDIVEPWVRQPAFFAVSAGTPRFDEPAKIIIGEYGRKAAGPGQMMVIDRGIMQGVQRGQRLTIFRGVAGEPLMRVTIGDGLIVAIRADSATILIERATDAAAVGDLVALHR